MWSTTQKVDKRHKKMILHIIPQSYLIVVLLNLKF